MSNMNTVAPTSSRVGARGQELREFLEQMFIEARRGQALSQSPAPAPARYAARFKNKDTHEKCLEEGHSAASSIQDADRKVL